MSLAGIYICARLDERFDILQVATFAGSMQRRRAMFIGGVDKRVRSDQRVNNLLVPEARGDTEERRAIIVLHIDLSPNQKTQHYGRLVSSPYRAMRRKNRREKELNHVEVESFH